jgi:hypothetical protein
MGCGKVFSLPPQTAGVDFPRVNSGLQGETEFVSLLLLTHLLALAVGGMIFGWIFWLHRRSTTNTQSTAPKTSRRTNRVTARPERWIAIRSVSPEAVKLALGLDNAAPCTWEDGLSGRHEFFISPRLNDWVILTGLGLPDPGDDVDATFLFLTALSKQLGHVQYFYASRLTHHHGWARLDEGCVTRAYAWTGETVWHQGIETLPEIEAGLVTFPYGDSTATIFDAENNFEKVPALAARWSIDPAEVGRQLHRQATGLAGESAFG